MVLFPIIVKFTDTELGVHYSMNEFLNSGCEEFDFVDGVEAIIDASGQWLEWNQGQQRFKQCQSESTVTVEYVRLIVSKHFGKFGPAKSISKLDQLDDIQDLVNFAVREISNHSA